MDRVLLALLVGVFLGIIIALWAVLVVSFARDPRPLRSRWLGLVALAIVAAAFVDGGGV